MELAERPTFDYLTDKLNNLKNKIGLFLLTILFFTPTIFLYFYTNEIIKSFSYFTPYFFFGAFIPILLKQNWIINLFCNLDVPIIYLRAVIPGYG